MWVLYALFSAMIWGANYLFYEKILHRISVTSLYIIDFSISILVFIVFSYLNGSFSKDITTIQTSKHLQLLIVASIITSILANLLIALAIQSKNASLAGIIEITYPVFIIILAWILFKENNLSLSVGIGGGLIFIGIAVIYYFNK